MKAATDLAREVVQRALAEVEASVPAALHGELTKMLVDGNIFSGKNIAEAIEKHSDRANINGN